jgi:membrane-bound lytic murein transglycosylase A
MIKTFFYGSFLIFLLNIMVPAQAASSLTTLSHTNWPVVWQIYQGACQEKSPQIPTSSPYKGLWSELSWQSACSSAFRLGPSPHPEAIRDFFESHFESVPLGQEPAKFTGYYLAGLEASYKKEGPYTTPVYEWPDDLSVLDLQDIDPDLPKRRLWLLGSESNLKPYPPRAQIPGHLGDKHVILWAKDAVDLFFLQIQGSGIVSLPDGGTTSITFSGRNGYEYKAIGKEVVRRGLIKKREDVTMLSIKEALRKAGPKVAESIMNNNPSYVFFKETKDAIVGASGHALQAQHSLAVDPSYHAYGLPFIIRIDNIKATGEVIETLAFSQDTGSAIRGPKRFDFFTGSGTEAMNLASSMNAGGEALVLLPKR